MTGLLSKTFGLEPFDPKKHKPQDLGLGGLSTEYLSTEADDDGIPFNFPTIWFKPNGEAMQVPVETARMLSLDYEKATGKKFPRFERGNFGAGAERAMHRSAMNGAMQGLLAK